MNRIIAISVMTAALLFAQSCDKYEDGKPPKEVRAEFDRMFPDAWDVEWERTASVYWVVSFETGTRPDGTDRKAWYDDKGVWIQTVTEVLLSDVPQNIKNYLQESQYGGATFEDNDAEYYQTQSQDDFYRFDLLIGGREIEVDVNTNGTVTQAQYGYFL